MDSLNQLRQLVTIGGIELTPLVAQGDAKYIILLIAAGVIFVIGLVIFVVLMNFFWLWIQSITTGANIGILDLIGMYFRRVDARTIVRSKVTAVQAGLTNKELTSGQLEAHYLAGGNVVQVIRALVAARKSKMINMSFSQAAAIDLAGRDVLEAVQTSVYPKVIDCPPRGSSRPSLDAVAQDGIQLKVKARVTVRANLAQLIGGATEETIIARVGEGIVSAIGSAAVHKLVLENPDMISKAVLSKKLDANTAFEIVSIDIADIDVGENIGARLQADRAEADMRVAQARAESRRAAAVAAEQEMVAKIEESRAKLVESEAEVPKAIAQAFATGSLNILDYYKLKNVDADTKMRSSIAEIGQQKPNLRTSGG
ncbi:MAG: flotillin-like protein FloA [Pirellulaceae bacterium]|nr:flotillin-like protein FloA [Pirellulaceae bacterium]